jgi:hypothetical protein
MVNTTSDLQTQLATSYTPDEIAFVKRVLDAMFETNNTQNREVMAVKGLEAMKLAKAPRDHESAVGATQNTQGSAAMGITQDRAEKILDQLVDEDRFEKSRRGFYSLSPRQLMELRGWLVETYNEEDDEWQRIKSCEGCKEIVTVVSFPISAFPNLKILTIHTGTAMHESRVSLPIPRLLCYSLFPHTC